MIITNKLINFAQIIKIVIYRLLLPSNTQAQPTCNKAIQLILIKQIIRQDSTDTINKSILQTNESMNNVQIIKKRLKDLKQLSQNLKQNTGDSEQREGNMNIVKAILRLTTDVNQKENQTSITDSLPQIKKQVSHELYQSVNKQAANQLIASPLVKNTKQQPITNVANQEKDHIQESIKNIKQMYKAKQIEKMQIQIKQEYQNQIQSLKIQNKKLNEQNNILRQKVNGLKQKIVQYQNSQTKGRHSMEYLQIKGQSKNKHLSYFKLDQNVGIFLTKIKIVQTDYSKVDYSLGQAVLHLQSIQVKPPQLKLRQSDRSRSSQQGEDRRKSIKPSKLDLIDLHKVQYFGSQVLILKFKDQDQQQRSLFLKFSDYEHLRKWDIGLYINYTLIKCLGKEKMFVQNFVFDETEESQLIRMNSIHKRGEFEHDVEKKVKDITNPLFLKLKLNQQQKDVVIEFYRLQFKLNKIEQRLKQKELYYKLDLITTQSIITNKNTLQKSKQKPMMQMHKVREDSDKPSQRQQSVQQKPSILKQEQQKIIKAKMQQQYRQRQKQVQNQRKRKQQFEREIKEKKNIQDYNQAKNILKKGMYMTKYAKGGFNPHEKKVYLSSDQKKLCWRDKQNKQNSEDDKYVLINEIKSINLGQVGPGIQKHVKTVTNLNNYVTIHLTSDRPSLQFGMSVADLMQNFVQNLKHFVGYNKEKTIKIF